MEELENIMNFKYINNKKISPIIIPLLDNIIKGEKYVSKDKKICFDPIMSRINVLSQVPKSKIHDSKFLPKDIVEFIDNDSLYNFQFQCKIKNRDINIYFVLFEEITEKIIYELKQYTKMIYIWFYVIDSYSNKNCSKNLNLYIYLTPFQKFLPSNLLKSLDSEHVNTAFTTGCKAFTEMVIFRKEEWFKVFIHETFHNFGLDFSDMNIDNINDKLRNFFNVNIDFNIYESYCETWARIINCLFYSYVSHDESNNKKEIMKSFYKNMKIEMYHSLIQCIKIINFMNLTYNLITSVSSENKIVCNYLYKEKTSVFSYYITTCLLMNNYHEFLDWCKENNTNILLFNKTLSNVDGFIDLIVKTSKNSNIIKNIKICEEYIFNEKIKLNDNMKMTILNIYE